MPPPYAELHCHSYFSLLDASSSPEDLAARAAELGLSALALTDHDSLAGAVRFALAARRAGLHAIFGAEVTLEDGVHLTLLAETQEGYGNLCRLVTASRIKGQLATVNGQLSTGGAQRGMQGRIEQLNRRRSAINGQWSEENGQRSTVNCQLSTDRTTAPSSSHPLTPSSPHLHIPSSPHSWPGKVEPALAWDVLATHTAGLIALSGCRGGPVAAPLLRGDETAALAALHRLLDLFGSRQLYVEVQHHDLPDDDRLVRRLLRLVHGTGVPVVATHNAHYATRDRSMARDVLIATRHNMTLLEARRAGHLPLNSNYALLAPAAMARRFAERPDAIAATLAIAERCQVSLDFSAQRLPVFVFDLQSPISPFQHLYELCHANLPKRYPDLRPAVLKQLAHELDLIEQAELAEYFLVVWDIVHFSRAQGIRCQGRGSAANSIVAYLLGITSIDPLAHNLLFERFLSSDKFTMPDIDIDFAADRREEVIQYVYAKYGHSHAAMVCNHVTYQARSALRDIGKALGLPEESITRIQGRLDTNDPGKAADVIEGWGEENSQWSMGNGQLSTGGDGAGQGEEVNGQRSMVNGQLSTGGDEQPSTLPLTIDNSPLTVDHFLPLLLRHIAGCPRHLSIHSGGMLITRAPLDAIVPLEPATMPGRFVCQWDKESVEDAGLIKIDLLALRTLGLVSEALGYIAGAGDAVPDLDALPLDDPAIYRMLHQADTIGAFQVESRAQQQMLPRLKPLCFEDIAVEVAIVRPGPIQGGAVHPYLRRRAGEEPVSYLHPSLEPVLRESLGVLLFQEQAIRVAVAAAGFAPGEADRLRRALSRTRSQEEMAAMRARFVRGAAEKEIDTPTAEAIFAQLAGFAGYGFCKSHAASFALIAYQTLWLKRYHAPAFYCALLNQQPMGFYPPEVIIGDARRHGVDTLPPEINRSGWQYTLERLDNHRWALRTGLHAIAHLGEQAWTRIEAARAERPFATLDDFCRRTRLPVDGVTSLIRAGALAAFGERRRLLWRLGELDYRPDEFDLASAPVAAELPVLEAIEQTAWEYELMGMSPERQMMAHYRDGLRRQGVLSTWQVKQAEAGQRVRVAGFVVVRQRPATAKGILFMSLEDESGLLDLVVKPDVYARLREVIRTNPLLIAEGAVQRNSRSVSVLVWGAVGMGG
ncbi:MAG: DNA polymerase III subunit alpha [Caldilinea sp.]|nr:DNA polymerase III subunit alpha [Caldilinea sp.]